MTPNPLIKDPPMVKKGERVGFEIHYGPAAGTILTGVVASVDTDEVTGAVQIKLEQDTITELEVDGDD